MNDTTNKYFLPAAVLIAGMFIAGAVIWNGARPAADGTGTNPSPSVDINNVDTSGNPFIGQESAPITLAFWSDFQCPFCKQFELTTLPQIIAEYVDTGRAKIVFMDFNFLGKDSNTAGYYSRSVWKLYPEQYFAWRTAMFEAQDEEGDQGFGDAESIDKLNATISGIDVAKVAADVKANAAAYQAEADADKAEGRKSGVGATPSLIVGKTLVQGAYPFATFKEAIDAASN